MGRLRSGPSPDAGPASTLTLDLPSFTTLGNKCSLFQPPTLWECVIVAQEDSNDTSQGTIPIKISVPSSLTLDSVGLEGLVPKGGMQPPGECDNDSVKNKDEIGNQLLGLLRPLNQQAKKKKRGGGMDYAGQGTNPDYHRKLDCCSPKEVRKSMSGIQEIS